MTHGRTARKRKLVLLVVAGTLVVAAVAELALAMFRPQATWTRTRNRTPTAPSEFLPFQLVPGARSQLVTSEFDVLVSINSQGHRGPEFATEPGAGRRIVAVGDSFTYGWGVADDETWPSRLEEWLTQHGPEDVEVINAGFAAGLGPDTYYLYLKEIGLGWQPDVVVVGFFVGNDVEFHGSAGGALEWSEVDDAGLPLRIRRGSYELVDDTRRVELVQRRYRVPVLRESHLAQAAATLLRRWRPPQPDFNRWLYRASYEERTSEKVEVTQRLFAAMADLCREAGVELIVVMIPAREQVHPDLYDFTGIDYMRDADLEKPQRLFAAFFEEQGIRYLDLLPGLRAAAPQSFYYPIDLHWTPAGTQWAAETVGQFLVEQ